MTMTSIPVSCNLLGRQRPLDVAACAVLYHCPALREPPQHGERPRRDDCLERRVGGTASALAFDPNSLIGALALVTVSWLGHL
jgi:hypothetical protein